MTLSQNNLKKITKKQLSEEEEDIRDGIKALEEKGTGLDWETFKQQITKRTFFTSHIT
jgi:hypothetical protein